MGLRLDRILQLSLHGYVFLSTLHIKMCNINKISYRKQIARQHSCHKKIGRAGGVDGLL